MRNRDSCSSEIAGVVIAVGAGAGGTGLLTGGEGGGVEDAVLELGSSEGINWSIFW